MSVLIKEELTMGSYESYRIPYLEQYHKKPKVKKENGMKEIEYLKNQIRFKNIIIKEFIDLYSSTKKALEAQKLGHINQWVKVQDAIDKIDDDFDVSVIKDIINKGN